MLESTARLELMTNALKTSTGQCWTKQKTEWTWTYSHFDPLFEFITWILAPLAWDDTAIMDKCGASKCQMSIYSKHWITYSSSWPWSSHHGLISLKAISLPRIACSTWRTAWWPRGGCRNPILSSPMTTQPNSSNSPSQRSREIHINFHGSRHQRIQSVVCKKIE